MAERMTIENKEEFAQRYVKLARKIGMKYLVRIPYAYKRNFCKNCLSYMIPGKNCRIRLKKKKITTTCLVCGKHIRSPFGRMWKKHVFTSSD
jgi:ribonuclease P protein subunit RPR2